MIKEYQEAIYKLKKIEKENDTMLKNFNGDAREIALENKDLINRHILMFENLEKKYGN